MQFLADRLDQFWWFVCERQLIWHKRVVQKLPFPWTTHPVLQRERFTNVYRELDPGTQYVITHILERPAPKADKIFNTMLYRLIGRAETHAALGFQYLNTFDPTAFVHTLKQLRDVERTPPFTAAYMVSAYRQMGSHDKIENIACLFALLQHDFADLYTRIEACRSSAEVHAVLSSAYGFGNFLAYQVLVDLLYPLRIYDNAPLLPYAHDDWASAGPGAQRGIALLLQAQQPPTHTGTTKTDRALIVMRWLHAHQHDEFARLELNFPYLTNEQGCIPLSLANIQNCLCEFHKFVKISEGWGRGRRKFSLRD
jgi:hypothetical protein